MATVSAKQFLGGSSDFQVVGNETTMQAPITTPTVQTQPKPSLSQRMKEKFGEGVSKAKQDFTQERMAETPFAGVQAAGDVIGGAWDAVGEAAKMVPGVEWTGEKIAQGAAMTGIPQELAEWAEQHPEAAKTLRAVVNIASIFPAGTITKAAGQAAMKQVPKVTQKGADLAKSATGKIDDISKPLTEKIGGVTTSAAEKFTDTMTPLEKGVETVLNPTTIIPKESLKNIPIEKIIAQQEGKAAKLTNYEKIAQKAVSDFSQKTPLTVAGDKGTEALIVLNNKLAKQGLLKQEALGRVGEKIVSNVDEFKNNLVNKLSDRVGLKVFVDEDGKIVTSTATGRASKIAFDPADNKLITDAYKAIDSLGSSPTVRQLDDTVDALQDLLYKRRSTVAIPVNSQVEGVLKDITGQLNKAVKKVAGEQYSKANAKFAHFIDTRDKLNKALGDEGVRGAALMKQLFSPGAEAPRRLFKQIKDLTGIDLTEEATLAKFVMENVGDARQASLLEEIIKGRSVTPMSFIEKAAERTIGKLQDPLKKARQTIEKPIKAAQKKVDSVEIKKDIKPSIESNFNQHKTSISEIDNLESKIKRLESGNFNDFEKEMIKTYSKYIKEEIKELNQKIKTLKDPKIRIKQEAKDWLTSWMSTDFGSTQTNPSKEVVQLLDNPKYKPSKPIVVHKAIFRGDDLRHHETEYSSWSTSKNVARRFGEEEIGDEWEIISKEVSPKEVFIELNKLPQSIKQQAFEESGIGGLEKEIILKPYKK